MEIDIIKPAVGVAIALLPMRSILPKCFKMKKEEEEEVLATLTRKPSSQQTDICAICYSSIRRALVGSGPALLI